MDSNDVRELWCPEQSKSEGVVVRSPVELVHARFEAHCSLVCYVFIWMLVYEEIA